MGTRRKWSSKEVALVARLRQDGTSYSQIACRVGATKGQISSLVRNRIDCSHSTENETTRWRLKQLLTSGYSCAEASARIGAPPELAEGVFQELYQ